MLSVSMTLAVFGDRSVLATSSRMRSRVSSSLLDADPTTMSTLATSARSVLAVKPSQKMLTPPATIGIEAVRVVFIWNGSPPALGAVGLPMLAVGATVSTALTTSETKMLALRLLDAWPSKTSDPSGILKDTNWSGIELGLAHMLAWGPHSWSAASSKSPLVTRPTERPTSWSRSSLSSSASAYSWHTCSMLVEASRKVPRPTRTESSGMSPDSYLSAFGLLLTVYLLPRVNVTCT
mmetsp:Transcript_29908/g.71936  ORF Transcript_29908/g.71936 Transcript_29908/m.71936 type:complete len:236 (+) Transcript_29908:670-1377(+)